MNNRNDGGPAYPLNNSAERTTYNGMSLRDWFAGMALQGLGSNQEWIQNVYAKIKNSDYDLDEFMAATCYHIADSMLQQREADQ